MREIDGNGVVALVLDGTSGGKVSSTMRYVVVHVPLPVLILSVSCTNPSNIVQGVVGLENIVHRSKAVTKWLNTSI